MEASHQNIFSQAMPFVIVAGLLVVIVAVNILKRKKARQVNPERPVRWSRAGLIWFVVCVIAILILVLVAPKR